MNQSVRYTVFFVSIFLAVAVYLFLRVIYVPLTGDELQTIHLYIQPGVFIRATGLSDANNHIVNTFLSHYLYEWFGFSNLTFRLTAFFSFFIYGHFLMRIGKEIKNEWTQYLFVLLLLLPVSFINFFALSRGYGMSMAFLTGSIYHLILLYKKKSWSDLLFFQVFTFLALLSNLSLMIPVLAISGMAFLVFMFHQVNYYVRGIHIVKTGIVFLPLLIGIKFCLGIAFDLKEAGALYYGNLNGLWATTMESLFLLFYEHVTIVHYVLVILALLVGLCLLIAVLLKKGFSFFYELKALPTVLLIGSLIGIQILALVLKINYPEDRVGIYLYLFFALGFVFLLDEVSNKIGRLIGLGAGALLIIINLLPINLTHQSIWYLDYLPDSYYTKIMEAHDTTDFPPTVAGYHMNGIRHSDKSYRMDQGKGNFLMGWHLDQVDSSGNVSGKRHPGYYADFIYAEPWSMTAINDLFVAIDSNKINPTKLYKRKKPASTNILETFKYDLAPNTNEFFNLVHKVYDSLSSDVMLVSFELDLEAKGQTFDPVIIADITNMATNERISYDYYNLNFLKENWKKGEILKKSFYLDNLPQDAPVKILVYIWNLHHREYQIFEGTTILEMVTE